MNIFWTNLAFGASNFLAIRDSTLGRKWWKMRLGKSFHLALKTLKSFQKWGSYGLKRVADFFNFCQKNVIYFEILKFRLRFSKIHIFGPILAVLGAF